jgi:hypothetical protein
LIPLESQLLRQRPNFQNLMLKVNLTETFTEKKVHNLQRHPKHPVVYSSHMASKERS